MVQAAHIPIDIAVSKMLDWLVDRRHCNSKWQKIASVAQNAACSAHKECSDDELVESVCRKMGIQSSHDTVDFVASLAILNAVVEADGKGGWTGTSPRVKIWKNVHSLYQKENCHLAEASATLTRLVGKELTSSERTISKLKTRQAECVEKAAELEKAAAACLARFSAECKKHQIDQEREAKPQILKGLHRLPDEITTVSAKIAQLKPARLFYLDFLTNSCKLEDVGGELAVLGVLCANENAVVYELVHGKAPSRIVRDVVEDPNLEEVDLTLEDEYSIEMVEEFEIEVEGDGIELEEEEGNTVLVSQSLAKGNEAKFVLEHPPTRALLLDDLAELESFLNVRREAKESNVAKWLDAIQNIYATLQEPHFQNLLRLADNPNTADRIADQLEKHKFSATKRKQDAKSALRMRDELCSEEAQMTKARETQIEKIHILKQYLEKEISAKYQNRPVNITGCRV